MIIKHQGIKPSHTVFRLAMIDVYRKHGQHLDAMEMLALAAHLCGQLVAIQDQRKVTPAMAMEVVRLNIEAGNAEAVDGLQKPEGVA